MKEGEGGRYYSPGEGWKTEETYYVLEKKKKRIGSLESKGPSATIVNDANWNCLSGQLGVVRPAPRRRCSTL